MRAALAGLLALVFAGDVTAQGTGAPAGKLPVPLLVPGKAARPAGTDPITIYAFDGGSGLNVRLSVKLVGEGRLVLHAPDGTPMLERTGTGSIDLEAVLSADAVFYVSVLRAKTTQPASLRLEVTEPDLHLAVFALGVGFIVPEVDRTNNSSYESRSCWLVPGVKLRRTFPKGHEEITLGRGGMETGTWKLNSGTGGARERLLLFADGNVTYRRLDGSAADVVRKVENFSFFYEGEKYYRYLCEEGGS